MSTFRKIMDNETFWSGVYIVLGINIVILLWFSVGLEKKVETVENVPVVVETPTEPKPTVIAEPYAVDITIDKINLYKEYGYLFSRYDNVFDETTLIYIERELHPKINRHVFIAMLWVESDFRHNVVRKGQYSKYIGLGQISLEMMQETKDLYGFDEAVTEDSLMDPFTNIKYTIFYINTLYDEHGDLDNTIRVFLKKRGSTSFVKYRDSISNYLEYTVGLNYYMINK
jgi:hypothetical protein